MLKPGQHFANTRGGKAGKMKSQSTAQVCSHLKKTKFVSCQLGAIYSGQSYTQYLMDHTVGMRRFLQ